LSSSSSHSAFSCEQLGEVGDALERLSAQVPRDVLR